MGNINSSQIFSILNACIDPGLYIDSMGMITGERWFCKLDWKTLVWEKAWLQESKL